MKAKPDIATIATLKSGGTIERHTSPRLVKWFILDDGKRTLLEKAPRWELVGNIEKFVLRRFADGATIHPN